MIKLRKHGGGMNWLRLEDKLIWEQTIRTPFRKIGRKRAEHLAGRILARGQWLYNWEWGSESKEDRAQGLAVVESGPYRIWLIES